MTQLIIKKYVLVFLIKGIKMKKIILLMIVICFFNFKTFGGDWNVRNSNCQNSTIRILEWDAHGCVFTINGRRRSVRLPRHQCFNLDFLRSRICTRKSRSNPDGSITHTCYFNTSGPCH